LFTLHIVGVVVSGAVISCDLSGQSPVQSRKQQPTAISQRELRDYLLPAPCAVPTAAELLT